MITGTTLGRGVASTPTGLLVPYTLLKVTKTTEGLAALAAESKRWREASMPLRRQFGDLARRAEFADVVLAQAVEWVRQGVGNVTVAQAVDGRVLGVIYYLVAPTGKQGYIALLATDPEHVPGAAPREQQLRGIGTGLVAAASRDLLAQGAESVMLHPLDAAADVFWKARGFRPCGLGGRLCVQGRAGIEALRGSCELRPDGPGDDCLFCGRTMTPALRVPVVRSGSLLP